MYSMYTERQGRKIADWLPFSRQFVLSADHFTTNQVVYMHDLSGIFFSTNQRFFCPAHTEMDQIYT